MIRYLVAMLVILRPDSYSARAMSGTSRPQRTAPGQGRPILGRTDARVGSDEGGGIGRRGLFHRVAALAGGVAANGAMCGIASAADEEDRRRRYFQRFPTLFAPIYGEASRRTVKRQIGETIWALEQSLELGPLQTPLRCVVVRLEDGSLWVHAPLAPTEEFFELVESCGPGGENGNVAHVVVPTYALEHKVFVKDALLRWPDARLWTAPGQFSFPWRSVPDEFVWGRGVSGVLAGSDQDEASKDVPWASEIQYETLAGGTFRIGGSPITFYETAFFHGASKSLIVTDSLAQVPLSVPELNDPANLLLVSKRSTADAQPPDTPEARQDGWEKTALLVSYFFPEHEELDPEAGPGVVTWTDGWHGNFQALAGRLIVPPVVRTLIYAQDPPEVRRWVNRIASGRWGFEQIVPAHFEAPIRAGPREVDRAFKFLEDGSLDPFPASDLRRGLRPIADLALNARR